jgi:integrase
VFHGLFLDRIWWGRWLEAALRGPTLVDNLMWLDLEPLDPTDSGPKSQPRRWFADPVTRMLLAHWHDKESAPIEQTAEECLRAFFNWEGDSFELTSMLTAHAERHWQFRMPQVLLAHAAGKHRAVPICAENWRRVIGCKFNADRLVPSTDQSIARKSVRYWCNMHMRVLARAANDIRYRRADSLSAKKAAADQLGKLNPVEPAERLMTSWCLEALTFGRGKQQRGLMPSTVKAYLGLLTEHIVDEADDLLEMSVDELVDQFDGRLALIEMAGRRARTLNAVRSLYHHLRRLRPDLPAFPLLLEAHASEQRASANLVSPAEFARALNLCRNADQQICLILGFRCGLRLGEILGLTAHDFFCENDFFELTVVRNEHRRLKTPTSRRILPLNKLLEGSELELVKSYLVERRAALRIASGNNLLIDRRAAEADDSLDRPTAKKTLDKIVSDATSGPLVHHHLRHSFASYLLATMLLPDDCPDALVPEQLSSVVSARRKAHLADTLLGKQKLGQHSLHAVSAALGHIVPGTTIRWYSHLLDLTVLQYVSRPAAEPRLSKDQLRMLTGRRCDRKTTPASRNEGVGDPVRSRRSYTTPVADRAPLDGIADLSSVSDWHGQRSKRRERRFLIEKRRQPKAADLQVKDCWRLQHPDWRQLAAVLCKLPQAETERLFATVFKAWSQAAERIFALRVRSGKARHQLDVQALLRSRKWASYVDDRWHPARRLASVERKALFYAIEHWDGTRSQVRFKSRPLAVAYRDLLISFGFSEAELQLTTQGKRFPARSSQQLHEMLAGADDLPGTAARRGSRGTIGITFRGNGERARQVRSAGHFVMLLLATREGYGAAYHRS